MHVCFRVTGTEKIAAGLMFLSQSFWEFSGGIFTVFGRPFCGFSTELVDFVVCSEFSSTPSLLQKLRIVCLSSTTITLECNAENSSLNLTAKRSLNRICRDIWRKSKIYLFSTSNMHGYSVDSAATLRSCGTHIHSHGSNMPQALSF